MSKLIKELLQESYSHFGQGKYRTPELVAEKFAEFIVKHIVEKIEYEAELAWAQDQGWTNSTLLALSLEILEDFGMEISDDWDAEAELNKIYDEFHKEDEE